MDCVDGQVKLMANQCHGNAEEQVANVQAWWTEDGSDAGEIRVASHQLAQLTT